MYRSEQSLANLLTLGATISVLLSCMGLFGMVSLVIKRRTKEIGIRKVLGASVGSVLVLINKEFVKPIVIAFLLATPIAWWSTHIWLQNYSWRISIQWWMFVLTGVLTLLIAICTVSFQSIKIAIVNPVNSLKNE
ncbi:hypothetical protein A4D02_13170 [Niastella koreensis]|uniref:ABC3 transporter permease C-terminal domain-containing protein n=1 Tax=Niastella koreensis TaxID=354356 RepID=A0ABX3NPX5_9BACT|nr:FtsX-like permease family protein [Niastella koreensis]OQP42513.1 hypothetical protein A4D02_13170 [Niastella koreensis]